MENMNSFDSLVNAAVGFFGLRRVSTKEVAEQVLKLATVLAPDLDESQLDKAIAVIETQVNIHIEVGVGITAAGYMPWLQFRKGEIEWKRWNAYSRLLRSKMYTPKTLQVMGERTDLVLDYAGDPLQEGSWSRRGLVIGDVQSGKTSNYLGLFNKAADAGYKVFILLAGSTDNLRKQTQERVDEGFVGKDSALLGIDLNSLGRSMNVGVGKFGVSAQSFTTVHKDFQTGLVKNMNLEIASLNSPVVFVVKKNKRILDNLATWLSNQQSEDRKLQMPMLLLDDEADYASINTNDADADPTAINKSIVSLLGLFEKNSYVGFTATPFANVLIDDEAPEDLFPKDFIFALESPDNYFGPERMFHEDVAETFLQTIQDASPVFPFKHRASLRVASLPESLIEAINSFVLVNAIRDLRGQSEMKRSMLVNVSRYKRVQSQVYDLILDFVSDLRNAINFHQLEGSNLMTQLEAQFLREFPNCGSSWTEVRAALANASDSISVQLVNSDSKKGGWDEAYKYAGARVIGVGGDVLSRGLTLEGLSTSYFYRKSAAYDTLMQMGRWFGYRDGYEDLCRLWIDQEVSSWYAFIAKAISELRDDLYTMRQAGLTPKEFGLAVLRHPGSLLSVTAFNKQRHGTVKTKVSMRNFSAETTLLSCDEVKLEENFGAFAKIMKMLQATHLGEWDSSSLIWRSVSPEIVADFLDEFHVFPNIPLLLDDQVTTWIRSTTWEWMKTWDVVVVGGSGDPYDDVLPGFHKPIRTVRLIDGRLSFNGKKQRLSGKNDIGRALPKDVAISMNAKNAQVNEKTIKKYLTAPVLVLYPVQVAKPKDEPEETMPAYKGLKSGNPLVGFHVAFPNKISEHDPDEGTFTYVVNKVWARLMGHFGPDTEGDDDNE